VLRLYDTQTGTSQPITAARRRELWMLITGPSLDHRPHLGDLRADLLPDLIRRCAVYRGLVVTSYETVRTADEPTLAAQRADRAAMNIHPADRTFPASEPVTRLIESAVPGRASDGLAFDVATGGDATGGEPSQARAGAGIAAHYAAHAGRVTVDGREIADPVDEPAEVIAWLSDVTELGLDPLALRLAFLKYRYREQADVTWDTLVAADRTLRRWRAHAAAWATEPSAPLVRSYADEVAGAFEDDLDSPAALRRLQALEADNAAPPGAKFETFAHLDQLFGLDLARDIGKY
jgi:cysteinyl-tRNA synthetase